MLRPFSFYGGSGGNAGAKASPGARRDQEEGTHDAPTVVSDGRLPSGHSSSGSTGSDSTVEYEKPLGRRRSWMAKPLQRRKSALGFLTTMIPSLTSVPPDHPESPQVHRKPVPTFHASSPTNGHIVNEQAAASSPRSSRSCRLSRSTSP